MNYVIMVVLTGTVESIVGRHEPYTLNEMQRRQYATTLSKAYGYGGSAIVHQITGLALNMITRGKKIIPPGESKPTRVRKPGGGPKKEFIEGKEPVIWVDSKEKGNIGSFMNSGTEYRWGKDPWKVLGHDFPIPELGEIAHYGGVLPE
jgi:hypothetical protein